MAVIAGGVADGGGHADFAGDSSTASSYLLVTGRARLYRHDKARGDHADFAAAYLA